MRQITISIPDSFYNTFLEFFKFIPDAKIETAETIVIPEWHKKETLKRIRSAKSGDFIPWERAKKMLKHKKEK